MAFPDVKWCLVCEDIRQEQRGLMSLLGFYGVTPYVEIHVRDFGRPLERISFLMFAEGEGDGVKHRHAFQVIGPDNEIVLPASESTSEPSPTGTGLRITFSITAISPRLTKPGLYRVVFKVDDEEHFTSTFTVRQESRPT